MSCKMLLTSLLRDPRGITVICNTIDGLEAGAFDINFVNQIFAQWNLFHEARCREEGLASVLWDFDEVWNSIAQYHSTRSLPKWWSGVSGADFELACRGTLKTCGGAVYGTSRPTEEIVEAMSNLSYRTISGRIPFFASASPYLDDSSVARAIRAIPAKARQIQIKDTASIPKYGRIFWFTQDFELRPLSRRASPANSIRDALGLVHYKDGFSATALFVKHDDLNKLKNARPTFADAATHRRFMSRARRPKHRKQSDWGWTVHLRSLSPRSREFDGLSERTASRLDGRRHVGDTFEFLPLGKTSGSRGDTSGDNDAVFARKLRRGRTLLNLLEILISKGIK